MRNSLLMILFILLPACATQPVQRADILVPLPCPEKPSIVRPHLATLPEDTAIDGIMVVIKQSMLKIMAYGDEASKQEGCSK